MVKQFPGSFFGPATLVDLVRHRAHHLPDEVAFTFLVDGENEQIHITYWELERQARAIAARLQAMNLAGERALLLYPPGLEFISAFFGCMFAGVVAVPAYPPRMNRKLDRIQAIVADCSAAVALTTAESYRRVEPMLEESPGLQSIFWLATDELPPHIEDSWDEPHVDTTTLSFLQYTSGSTGTPKGVMLTHGNLLHNSALITYSFENTRSQKGVFWLPSYHDMGLIGGILQPIYFSRPVVLMSPMAFLQRPVRWLQAISNHRATVSGGPNFAFDLVARKVTPEQMEGLDLSSWKLAFNGAEPVRADTLERFTEKFESCGFRLESFYPCYGLAEATLIATGGYIYEPPIIINADSRALENDKYVEVPAEHKDARQLIGCGQSLPDQEVLIVDPETHQPKPDGEIGEIWIKGPSVARGYWNRPEETAATFGARRGDNNDGPFLRTGDLGFQRETEFFVTGRLKDLIIVHGLNHYPQDIEHTVQNSHEALRPTHGAAFTVEVDGKQKLIVVQEIERRFQDSADDAIAAIRKEVARHHELVIDHVVLVRAGNVPKTSSGKIQRSACRRAYLEGNLTIVGRWPDEPEATKPDKAITLTNGRPADGEDQDGRRVRSTRRPTLNDGSEWDADNAPAVAASKEKKPWDEIAAIVMEEVARIAQDRALNATIDSSLSDVGLDSLERFELQTVLEDRLGGRMPEEVAQELETLREVVDAVQKYLGEPQRRKRLALSEIPESYHRFDRYAEYQELHSQMEMLDASGLENPFFNLHETVARDTTVIDGREMINFSSYNYLGLSGDPRVTQAAQQAIEQYGTSVSASRVVSGEKPLHRKLERAIADCIGTDDAVVMVGGHATNETTIGHLFGPSDLILHDSLAHNSIIQGCILSGARRRGFPHNDWQALERLLDDMRGEFRRVLIVIEGVYSMDGDFPELPKFVDLRNRYKTFLMVDEAHSLGVLGQHGHGIGEHFDIDPAEVDLWMGTLSKSCASCGGYIAGNRAVVEYLKHTAPGFVYSVGIPPANAAAALEALRVMEAEPERVKQLHQRSALFLQLAKRRGIDTGMSNQTPVIPAIIGNGIHCLQLSRAMKQAGINVQPILPPAVEENKARLRFFISSTHTDEQIRYTVDTLAKSLEQIRGASPEAIDASTTS
ncbi:MAG: aminotransferase class I/II-fold pyridoxal phosphate-dependent enzyme [Pirellulales bacterium]|nr:aminotransferase class I/II-fold pyridoxal phosphate-dependent enzyme [Pirellulales bacterium]